MSLPPSVFSRASLNRWPTTISAIAGPKMAVLNLLHFAGSVVGIVPERHVDSVCMHVSKRHTSCGAAPQTPRLRANRSRQRKRCEPWGVIAARFFSLFALISPTSSDTKNARWYFIQTFILWIDMDNWYNLSALNHPTMRSDKAFPPQRRGDDLNIAREKDSDA